MFHICSKIPFLPNIIAIDFADPNEGTIQKLALKNFIFGKCKTLLFHQIFFKISKNKLLTNYFLGLI
jgi:hypothetical protein